MVPDTGAPVVMNQGAGVGEHKAHLSTGDLLFCLNVRDCYFEVRQGFIKVVEDVVAADNRGRYYIMLCVCSRYKGEFA